MNIKKKILYISSTFIFLILLNKIIGVFLNFENFINLNELFINYEGGFLRRGLLGQAAFSLFKVYNINPIIFFSIIFSLANFIFFIFYFICIKKFKDSFFLYLILIFSPATLMFSIFDSVNFFNNQIFLLILVILHTIIALKYSYKFEIYKKFLIFLILPFLFLSILQYDPQILTLSIHLYITYFVISKSNPKKFNIFFYYIVLIVPIFLIISNNGTQDQLITLENMKDIVKDNYFFIIDKNPESFSMIETNDLGGNLNLKIGALIKIFGIYFEYNNKIYLMYSVILSILVFCLIFTYLIDKKVFFLPTKLFPILLGVLPLFSLFLFITDFGRAIHIFLIHLLVIFFFVKVDKEKELSIMRLSNFKNLLFAIILIIYSNTWTLSHAAGWTTIFNPTGPKYSNYSSYMNEIKKISYNLYYYTDKYLLSLPKAEFMMPFLER